MTGSNLTDQQLQQVVDKTINYLDKNADGKIGFEDFTAQWRNPLREVLLTSFY